MKASKALRVVVASVILGASLGVVSAVSSYADPEGGLSPATAIAGPGTPPLIWAHGGGGGRSGGIGGIYFQ